MDDKTPAQTVHLTVVSPNEVLFENDVKKVLVPTTVQEIAVLPDHTPLYAKLKAGDIEITAKNDKITKLTIEGGIIRVKMNIVSIIVGF